MPINFHIPDEEMHHRLQVVQAGNFPRNQASCRASSLVYACNVVQYYKWDETPLAWMLWLETEGTLIMAGLTVEAHLFSTQSAYEVFRCFSFWSRFFCSTFSLSLSFSLPPVFSVYLLCCIAGQRREGFLASIDGLHFVFTFDFDTTPKSH